MRLPAPFTVAGEHIAVELPGARAVFTTRRGGHSKGPYESLNFGFLTDDDRDDVRRNRETLAAQFGVRFAYIRQIHGTTVARVSEPSSRPTMEADAQVTATHGIAPMVMTADCLPLVVAGGGGVAVIHAGWRGLADGVIVAAVGALSELASDGPPLVAAIGPGAGPCCYEVGDEVHAEFTAHGELARHGPNLDLKAIARAQLEDAGATAVHDVGLCTICSDPSLFFSHRRDQGVTGRQAGIAWLI